MGCMMGQLSTVNIDPTGFLTIIFGHIPNDTDLWPPSETNSTRYMFRRSEGLLIKSRKPNIQP